MRDRKTEANAGYVNRGTNRRPSRRRRGKEPSVWRRAAQTLLENRILAGVSLAVTAVLVFSCAMVGVYAADYAAARRASGALREVYYLTEDERADADVAVSIETPQPTIPPRPAATAAAPIRMLGAVKYPGNPTRQISSRFERIRRQNADIVGWLTLEGLIDEAVVQRDNEYYLRRDYRGYHNENGAIFLDQDCALSTRPYTMTLYGHNMKSGAMFGGLRNYEDIGFYRGSPLFTFDTMYEDGRYVIFCVATVSLDQDDWDYVNLSGLYAMNVARREAGIRALERASLFTSALDVAPDDQLVLLVTCVGDEDERRIVAARRVRDGEDEDALKRQVSESARRK